MARTGKVKAGTYHVAVKEGEIICVFTTEHLEGLRDAVRDQIDALKLNYTEDVSILEDIEFFESLKLRLDKYAKRARTNDREYAKDAQDVS